MTKLLIFLLAIVCFDSEIFASKLVFFKVLDKDYIELYFRDGDVTFDETKSPGFESEIVRFGDTLNTSNIATNSNWGLLSTDDANYSTKTSPISVYRKSKLGCMSQEAWSGNDFEYTWAYDHFIFLKLPYGLQTGKTYTLNINNSLNSDSSTCTFTYDIFSSKSEAIKINITGYSDKGDSKKTDLYMWLGDGGARDYSDFIGKKVYVYNIETKTSVEMGTVSLHAKKASETKEGHKMLLTDVWGADFSVITEPGTYRVAIEDVGCSEDFVVATDIYKEPFRVSILGYYYMRIGEREDANTPSPRQPSYIPGEDPSTCVVYITDMSPYHDEWDIFSTSGDKWDAKFAWGKFKKEGNPTNPNAYGGHSDAKDWDRHLAHVSNIYDMLLPYFLTGGRLYDDNLGIPESYNSIPDVMDEARNEVDFFLRLRYNGGYSHGLNNPGSSGTFYQADNTPMAAWANAANAAMLSNCFMISGHTKLMETYRDSAINAFNYASKLPDKMLLRRQEVGSGSMSGNDFRMTAAAYLYNVTGDTAYENVIAEVSRATTPNSVINSGMYNQVYATAAYLGSKQPIHYQELYNNMKASIIYQAKAKEADYSYSRPSRRASDNDIGWFVTEMGTQRTIVAHAFADSDIDKQYFKTALLNEYDWTLGRNPLNMIQMTTATTDFETKRSVNNAYTSGWSDGTPGVHPGQTPFMNIYDWWAGMIMGMPSWMTDKNYPSTFNGAAQKPENLLWPHGELYYNTRFVYCANEFTPRQTMRGKMALYGYLYGSEKDPSDAVNDNQGSKWIGNTSIFPNPTISHFTVISNEPYTLEVFNSSGDKVYENHSDQYIMFGNEFLPGIYFWNITTENSKESGIITKL